ncbi:glycoside hydrolase family 2 protein [Aspergillus tanneri]|uniref:Glycoside hydrolase family 2 protein n=1 Tax=Aspergillus tanneri TaxID=1220188 RepID=A0A5M9ME79_9EURO|nr:uncharacterized protein ATNIH1004_006697 [Aspergillus tanneri]KAA8645278.1 hypothetical protein ATNIH1004_006697 [Aspergillus tanneri]
MNPYPRPDFQRPSLNWSSLDGTWDFVFDDDDAGLSQQWHSKGIPDSAAARAIQVPYAFQTPASGIDSHEAHEVLWYERQITDIRTPDELECGHRLLLRFGAVDYECTAWVDGQLVGGHRGGHVPFDLDISDAVSVRQTTSPQRLTVRVRDAPYDLTQPRGKQYWGPVPQEIFYTPTSGIWQSLWLESVPRMRLASSSEGTILRSDDIKGGQLHARIAVLGRPMAAPCQVEVEASLTGIIVSCSRQELGREKDYVNLDVDMHITDAHSALQRAPFNANGAWHDRIALWAPEHPVLYDLSLRLLDASGAVVDEVRTTTGMRRVSWQHGDATFRLNGQPIFQTLVLDQGYWPQTGLAPPTQEALKADIEMAQSMGFNGCRKHQKVEDPVFLYWADRLGFLVWGEMANGYVFGDEYMARYNSEWIEAVKRDLNHPSIVVWTPFNESWGYPSLKDSVDQRNHIRMVYYLTKNLDPTRPINDNCGWEHVQTDLTTYHDYSDSPPRWLHLVRTFQRAFLASRRIATLICSEFGGVNILPAQGTVAGDRDWGYTTARDPEDLLRRLEKLVMAVVKGGHSCGLVYTQLYDIEQEVNGLYSYERQAKVPVPRVKAIMDAAQRYYHEVLAPK